MSLLSRLFLPVLIAILPAIGIEIFDEFDARNMADATVRSEAVRLRDTIQTEQARVFDGIRQVASLVAGSAAVRDGDAPGCQVFLDRAASALLPEQTISVTDRSGTVISVRWTPAMRQVAMRESCSYKRLRNRSSE